MISSFRDRNDDLDRGSYAAFYANLNEEMQILLIENVGVFKSSKERKQKAK